MCRSVYGLLALLCSLLMVCSASAAPIVNSAIRPVTVLAGDNPSLQNILNSLFTSGGLNVGTDQSSFGSFQATANTTFTYLQAVAGYKNSNVFGLYTDTATQDIFNGVQLNSSISLSQFAGHDIGMYLKVYAADGNTSTLDYTLFTDDLLNPGQLPHALIFVGSGQTFANGIGDGTFDDVDIIIAFEDLNRSQNGVSDDDFNDLVVLIERVQFGPPPVTTVHSPEPGSLILWGLLSSCGGLAAWRRARKRELATR